MHHYRFPHNSSNVYIKEVKQSDNELNYRSNSSFVYKSMLSVCMDIIAHMCKNIQKASYFRNDNPFKGKLAA